MGQRGLVDCEGCRVSANARQNGQTQQHEGVLCGLSFQRTVVVLVGLMLMLGLFNSAFGVMSASAEQTPTPTPTESQAPDGSVAPAQTQPASTNETAATDPANETAGPTASEQPAPEPSSTSAQPAPTTATPEPTVRPRGMVMPMAVAGTTATCSAGTYYSITETGRLYKVTQTTAGFTSTYQATSSTSTTSIGSPGLSWANYGTWANSLGIGKNGQTAYALEVKGSSIYSVKKYSATTGAWTSKDLVGASGYVGKRYEVDGVTMVPVTGAVDPATGKYLVGGFGTKTVDRYETRWVQEQVWVSYYPVGSPYYWSYGYWAWEWVEREVYVGSVQTPVFIVMQYDDATNNFKPLGSMEIEGMSASGLNGDMAFDAAGNLLVIANEGPSGKTSMLSIPATEITRARASSTPILFEGSQSNPKPFGLTGAVDGLAFSSDGRTYIGSDYGVWYGDYGQEAKVRSDYWPNDGYQYGWVTDLASCATPSTISLQKDVVGRYDRGDNFRLVIQQTGDIYGENTTIGYADGIQAETVGPLPAITGTTYTIRETMPTATDANGATVTPNIDAKKYDVTYTCTANGTQFATGTLTSANNYAANITVPNTPSVAVNCVIKNTPKKSLTVRKQWTVDGKDLPLGATPAELPAGYSADLALDDDVTANWNQQYTYPGTKSTVKISETTAAGRCTVKQTLQYFNGQTVNGAIPNTPTLQYGDNTAIVKNEVTCDTKLSLIKKVEGGTAQPSEWTLTAKDPAGTTAVSGAGTASGTVKPDTAFTLAESAGNPLYVPSTTTGGVQQFQCVELDKNGQPTTQYNFTDTADNKVTVPKGAHVQCTIINRTATLTVQKLIEGTNDLQPNQFVFTATPATGVTGLNPVANIPGANTTTTTNTFNVRPGHNYAVTEKSTNPNLAYVNTKVQKLDASGNWVDIDPAAIKVPAGEHWTIRYVNTSPGAPALPLTGGLTGMLPIFGAGSALGILALAAWYVLRRKPTGPLLG